MLQYNRKYFLNHYKNCCYYGAIFSNSYSESVHDYYEKIKSINLKELTNVAVNQFNELYRNIFAIEAVERIQNIKYDENNITYIDYIVLYRKELKLFDSSVNTGKTPRSISRKSINHSNASPKDEYNILCHDFPIQDQYRQIFKCVEEVYNNVFESMKSDDIRRRYNKLGEYKIKLPPSQEQYDELKGIRQEITDFSEELSNIKLPEGYCNYKNELYIYKA